MTMMMHQQQSNYHYALETSRTLLICLHRLEETLEQTSSHSNSMYDLYASLLEIQRLLHAYLLHWIERERELVLELEYDCLTLQQRKNNHGGNHRRVHAEAGDNHNDGDDEDDESSDALVAGLEDAASMERIPSSLQEAIDVLEMVVKQRLRQHEIWKHQHRAGQTSSEGGGRTNGAPDADGFFGSRSSVHRGTTSYRSSRNTADTLLFRLTVVLQLCTVRVDDAHLALTGHHRRHLHSWRKCTHESRSSSSSETTSIMEDVWLERMWDSAMMAGVLSAGYLVWRRREGHPKQHNLDSASPLVSRLLMATAGFWITRRIARRLWTRTKIVKSHEAMEEWIQSWIHVTTESSSFEEDHMKSQRLIDYTLQQSNKSSFWHSEGEVRFLLLKRAMDLLYASVGTAISTHRDSSLVSATNGEAMQLSFTAMAAASYYNLVGPHQAAKNVLENESTQDRLIHNTWSMISLPSVKRLSLRATRLFKGAALAERTMIAGVPCFLLSKDPCPEIVASLKRHARQERRRQQHLQQTQKQRRSVVLYEHRLSTIDEHAEHNDLVQSSSKTKLGKHGGLFERRNVIFHLTGGGFFAHTLASDIPYLLDWSARTGAVVICPEYALLPEYPFPTALHQVTNVYKYLMKERDSVATHLGLEVDRMIVTGESAGGNLAAAMLIQLYMDMQDAEVNSIMAERQDLEGNGTRALDQEIPLPSALMLSCPALNLSLELSPSRVLGNDDPVLPTGLLAAISNGYIPTSMSKDNPLASPFFATDDMLLRVFPPATLLFATSNDPFLDDCVEFNQRLKSLGKESNLRAVQDVPHAYLGLAMAGFPEVQRIQAECVDFLVQNFDGSK